MNAVIIDDETKGRNAIKSFINKYAPNISIVGEAENVQSGLLAILLNQPDIVFLDVNMPDGTGFDLLEQLPKIDFKLIFVTAFEEHAVKAFKYSAVDFLLKPLNPDDFITAVSKVEKESKLEEIEAKIALLLKNNCKLEKIALPSHSGLKMVYLNEIIRCESSSNYTTFFLASSDKVIVSKTLKEYDQLFKDEGFYRIHKSHLINLKFIKEYINGEGGSVLLDDDTQIEVSRRRKEGLIQLLTVKG